MKSFTVSWHASGYTGTFSWLVVADSLAEAQEMWERFAAENSKIKYSWEKAAKAMKNHYGGYTSWKESGDGDGGRERGCYELEYDAWKTGSDHLRD